MDSRDLQTRLRDISRERATKPIGPVRPAPAYPARHLLTDEPENRLPAVRSEKY